MKFSFPARYFLNKQVTISVPYLVERMLRVGNLESGGSIQDISRAWAQAEYERFREPEYRFRVPLAYSYNHHGAAIEVRGQIAGLYEDGELTRIETIELLSEPAATFIDALDIIAWGKAKVYAYIVAEKSRADRIEVFITWYHRKDLTRVERRETFTFGELHDYFESLLNSYLEWAGFFSSWNLVRDPSIHELAFPFAPYRPGQRSIMAAVYTAVKNNRQSLIQAPTGVGKTLASLFPALKALQGGFTSKIFYLTARTTGREVAENALSLLQQKGLRIKAVTITAKEKICARKDAIRECDDCKYALGYHSRIKDALQHGFRHDLVSRNTVERIASEYILCPFEFSLDLSLAADIIICDYNYVFDPNVYLKRYFNETCTDPFTFLVDEAHNLVDRGRSMYSAEINKETFVALGEKIRDELPDIFAEMEKVIALLREAELKCIATSLSKTAKEPPKHLFSPLRKVMRTIEDWIGRKSRAFYKKELVEFYFDTKHFVATGELFNEDYASIEQCTSSGFTITLFCLNPAPLLGTCFDRSKSAILFSATISPMHYFQDILGLKNSCEKIALPSPFPAENVRLLCADRVSTRFQHREFTLDEVIDLIVSLVNVRPGNYMAFFPSYAYMETVFSLFTAQHPELVCFMQTPMMPEHKRSDYINRFCAPSGEPLIGFAVLGGVFGEGIDLLGERLCGAIITGVGLPGLSPERDLIREYFDTKKCGFEYAYLYPGMNKVLQAAGRVIRSETDKGVIMLIDDRFATSRYYSLFPKEWRPVAVRSSEDIKRVVGGF